MALLTARGIQKSYTGNGNRVTVLQGVDLALGEGEFVVLFGASGSGKSTLLHILGGLDRPDAGEVVFQSQSIYAQRESALAAFRNRHVGFVFQFYHLLPEYSALENVMMPCLIGGTRRGAAKARASALLAEVGLDARSAHRPHELSGGEQQRVTVARALAQEPPLLLADEPTGNLDEASGTQVMTLLKTCCRARGMTLLVVTHNPDLIREAPRKFELKGGTLHEI